MKHLSFFIFPLLLILAISKLSAQDSINQYVYCQSGISLEYGVGSYAVTDEYISKEKYSGAFPYYGIRWVKPHDNYVYHLGLSFRNSSDIKNNNVSTDIYQFTLNQGFNYALPKFTMFGNDVYLYLGPSTELFFYYNSQNIAVAGFDYAQSIAMLISLGLSSELYYKLSNNFYIETSLDFNILSLGFRMIDNEESDESPVKILTAISATNASLRLGTRYKIKENLSIKASYLFNLTMINTWETLHSASDNLIFTITYGF